MPPVVSIVGKSKSGKTTLMEKLLGELKSRGYRVATVKHTPQKLSFDEPGKDSWRHIQAGSEATLISSPDKVVLIKPTSAKISLEQIARLIGEDYDIILTEGFSQGNAPKIEVHRKQAGPPLTSVKKLIAIATDEPLETKTRQFSLEDTKGLADLLEKGFVEPQRERVSLYVNDTPIVLSSFP
ncbi:MAG: molybdopterin-guanine dinucleotide biosynthesis protein B, partial [Dehalococcoidia bacterium]|nr:molybdopterin-guanine dinucleotide biosynthesis protein B [Dehalococcoidia bacterium]